MYSTYKVSRREFLKWSGLAASAAVLGACTPRSSTPATPAATAVLPASQATPTPLVPTTTTPSAELNVETQSPQMALVEAGSFEMGSATYPDEQPIHTVRLTRSFYVAMYAVTFEEYDQFCDATGQRKPADRSWGRGRLPVVGADWYHAIAYCNWLSEKEGLTPCYTGKGILTQCDFSAGGYRLPAEAEWEYAARGGAKSQDYLYAGSDNPDEVAWYADNSGDVVHPVGQKLPNELGLYDMSGNMYEWCWDWYGEEYYAASPGDDPTGPPPTTKATPRGPEKVRRSGSWRENADCVRIAYRSLDNVSYPGDNGFRLFRTKI